MTPRTIAIVGLLAVAVLYVGGDTKAYGPYNSVTVAVLIAGMKAKGLSVTGSGPWTIATKEGVTFVATYDADARMLTFKITERPFYAPYFAIWSKLDAALPKPGALTSG